MGPPKILKALLWALEPALNLFQISSAAAEGCCRPAPATPAARLQRGRWRAAPGQSAGGVGGPSRSSRARPPAPALLPEAAFGGCCRSPLACPMISLTVSAPCLASVCCTPLYAMIPMARGRLQRPF